MMKTMLVLFTIALFVALPVSATVIPSSIEATLWPGEFVGENKTVEVTALPAKADVIFAFDCTGSMGGTLADAKANAADVMAALELTGVDIQYGVMSHRDYPGYFDSCDYGGTYGEVDDWPYLLEQAITDDTTDIQTAINGLSAGGGWDGPESYSRLLYETYSDPNVGWRIGAKRIVVSFGDVVPHDCDMSCLGYTESTGIDPGRDATLFTADDLAILDVIDGMADANIILLEVQPYDYYQPCWDPWVATTGGSFWVLGGFEVDDMVDVIISGLTTPNVCGLTMVAESGFESWLTSVVPESYDCFEPPATMEFDITITVPEGTECGDYTFTVSAVDEDGVSYGDQEVTIHVPCVLPVDVDFKPGSCPNAFNRGEKGVLPVAILGSDTVDVSQIDPETVLLEGVAPIRWSIEDTGAPVPCDDECQPCECWQGLGDGYLDLNLKFESPAIAATSAVTGATVKGDPVPLAITGELFDGTPISGGDCLWIVK
ncbi:MAG TPA: hypothetical protein PK154_04600 [Methanoregulaceae archaeon]|nr:hypothetical protein [Methanoregulaceae archaeon]HQM56836.1 hypothetical protein [Methanoregulaceae archaeon]